MTTSSTAAVFPGQGSQAVGMGRALWESQSVARDAFAEADRVLGYSISTLCFEGPDEELKRTSHAQPALLTVSTAYLRVLTEGGFTFDVVAGHSLGEYSALVAAGALSFPDALRLVQKRGELMEKAAAREPGGMAAVLGLADDEVVALCAEVSATHGTLVAANFNSPSQVVVSGAAAAIAAVREAAKMRGGRALPLPVSGAFHSPLMAEAAAAFVKVLDDTPIQAPRVPIVQNVTGEATSNPEAIRENLARQIIAPVLWTRTLQTMAGLGMTRYVEIGPGAVLTGLVKRTLPEATAVPASDLPVKAG